MEKQIIKLEKNENTLENEKERFISIISYFIDNLNLQNNQIYGRPKANIKTIIKSLLIMSYHSMSYRRAKSDLKKSFEEGLLDYIPGRSTLNDYANKSETRTLLENLIKASALFFIENEDTIILDSTWLGLRMYAGGYRKVYDKTSTTLQKCRKLHIACLKNSKVIACAKTTHGTFSDSPLFPKLVMDVIKEGFTITTLIADAGYSSKDHYALCKELGIKNVFIDFRSNATIRRGKSDIWKEKLILFKENKEIWYQTYRFRALIEGVFSAIKRKNINYLRSKKETAQDVELLLKVLVYNLTIIGKYS